MNSTPRLLHIGTTAVVSLLLVTLLSGCAAVDGPDRDYIDPGTTDLRVERLDLRGVESVSERQLRQGLATVEDPGWRARRPWYWLPLIGERPQYFNRFGWQRDRERILAYYRQQGYFHASIQSESIIEDPDAGSVRIRVTIDEGEPTRVSRIDFQGLTDGETPGRDTLLGGVELSEGDIFIQNAYQRMRSTLRDRLREAGHAYADVSGRVFIDRASREAEIFFFVEAGPASRIGPVYVLGLDEIDEQAVRQAIPFREGDPYTPGALRRAQEEIFDLGVFGMVTVLPAHEARETTVERERDRRRLDEIIERHDLPEAPDETEELDPDIEFQSGGGGNPLGISDLLHDAQRRAESRSRLDPEVPIVIRVQEATGYNLRVGGGIAAEGTRQDVRGLVNWSSRNFLGGLRRLEHFNAVGYAWAPGLITPEPLVNRGPILSSELRFQQPQFFEPRTNLRLRARVERDVREGYTVWNPSFRMGLERPFFDHFLVGVSYNAAYFNYSDVQPDLIDPTATELGVDFETEFLLEYFEQSIAYDRRDDVINPTRGYSVELAVQQAGQYAVRGDFDFVKPTLSAQQYFPFDVLTPSVLALRARAGSTYDIGRETGVPVESRLYSGGTDGMRSFGRRRLSLYTPGRAVGEDLDDAADDAGRPVPVGGGSQFEFSVEPRFRLVADLLDVGDLWGAVFLDSATVLRGQLLADTDANPHGVADVDDIRRSLLYGLGSGIWWNTPVGPVRLDFAYTLSDITEDARFRRCVDPADYGTDACEFRYDADDDPIQNLILGYGVYLSIGHSF